MLPKRKDGFIFVSIHYCNPIGKAYQQDIGTLYIDKADIDKMINLQQN